MLIKHAKVISSERDRGDSRRETGHMDQTSILGPYFFLARSSGAAYAGLPHCVLNGSEWPRIPAQLLKPKSARGGQNQLGIRKLWTRTRREVGGRQQERKHSLGLTHHFASIRKPSSCEL